MLLDSALTNLNAGSLSPTSIRVSQAASDFRRLDRHWYLFEKAGELLGISRKALAEFLGVQPDHLYLLPNITVAMMLVVNAVMKMKRDGGFGKRNRLVLTELEYGAMASMWETAATQHGIEVVRLSISDGMSSAEIVAKLEQVMDDRVILVLASHVVACNGIVLPVSSISSLAKRFGAMSVIDGAHAPGLIHPLDASDIGCDVYCGNAHKWLMSESTCGFLWSGNDQLRYALCPLVHSFPAKDLTIENRDRYLPSHGGTQHQAAIEFWGSRDRAAEMVLPHAIEFFNELGHKRIQRRQQMLAEQLIRELASDELAPVPAPPEQRQWAMTAYRFPCCDRAAFRRYMMERHRCCMVVARTREDVEGLPNDVPIPQQRYYLRISTAWWNTEEEISHGVSAIRDLLRERPKSVFPGK